ncbi:hypothetical protein RhiirA4_486019 [Rhizophagus irregularis]|uniref:Uncharacterized protein n=1 Tax=Rhizophagus irregularis TaxID=588596 RepID=A0A2I1HQV6_9GLOM|nr:hypothetical protein RhiirA4_486019 [Rhizophagus irregularis]
MPNIGESLDDYMDHFEGRALGEDAYKKPGKLPGEFLSKVELKEEEINELKEKIKKFEVAEMEQMTLQVNREKNTDKKMQTSHISKSSKDGTYWKDEEIYDTLKKVGYVERLGSFRQDYQINKVRYILIYINNEKDLLQAIYTSTMEEEMGKGEQFEDALISPKLSAVLIVPRSKEEHANYNNLNNGFSERLDKISNEVIATSSKKLKAVDLESDELNENKKRVVTHQVDRADSDDE